MAVAPLHRPPCLEMMVVFGASADLSVKALSAGGVGHGQGAGLGRGGRRACDGARRVRSTQCAARGRLMQPAPYPQFTSRHTTRAAARGCAHWQQEPKRSENEERGVFARARSPGVGTVLCKTVLANQADSPVCSAYKYLDNQRPPRQQKPWCLRDCTDRVLMKRCPGVEGDGRNTLFASHTRTRRVCADNHPNNK